MLGAIILDLLQTLLNQLFYFFVYLVTRILLYNNLERLDNIKVIEIHGNLGIERVKLDQAPMQNFVRGRFYPLEGSNCINVSVFHKFIIRATENNVSKAF